MYQFLTLSTFANMNIDVSMTTEQILTNAFVPASFLDFDKAPAYPFVILVLNSPIVRGDLYERCAPRAMATIAVDGGGNQIFDYVKGTGVPKLMNTLRPETIIGDLDSLRPDTEKFFRDRGTTIVKHVDLYSTDFTKALKHVASQTDWWLNSFNRTRGRQEQTLKVLIFGGLGGRADQAFSQIHHLYLAAQDPNFAQLELYLTSGDGIMFALRPGPNIIDTPLGLLGKNIGIIPVGKPASITTSGLEWDVTDWETSFGTQLSTSNYITAQQVTVSSTERVLFTVEVPPPAQDTQGQQNSMQGFEDADGMMQSNNSSAASVWPYT